MSAHEAEYERLRTEHEAAVMAYSRAVSIKTNEVVVQTRRALDGFVLPPLELLAEVAAREPVWTATWANKVDVRLPADLWARIQAAVKP